MSTPFWVVWGGDASRIPMVRHDTLDQAEAEARRLATLNPERSFWVLAAAVRVKSSAFEIERFDCDSIPF